MQKCPNRNSKQDLEEVFGYSVTYVLKIWWGHESSRDIQEKVLKSCSKILLLFKTLKHKGLWGPFTGYLKKKIFSYWAHGDEMSCLNTVHEELSLLRVMTLLSVAHLLIVAHLWVLRYLGDRGQCKGDLRSCQLTFWFWFTTSFLLCGFPFIFLTLMLLWSWLLFYLQ